MRLFSDQKKLLLATFQNSGVKLGDYIAEEAINAAYRKVASLHPWSYLHRRTQINTQASYSTGTIAYTSSTNVLTLTGGTWPSWTYQGLIVISGHVYAVQRVISSTTLSLVADRAPTADVASGTAYTLFQKEYLLPENFLRTEEFVQVGTLWNTREISPGSMAMMEQAFYRPSRPWNFMIRGSTYFPGRMCMEFAPPPDAAYVYDLAYYAKPRPRTMNGAYTAGTISVSGGTAVVGVGTAFTQAMVGCRLRQGTTGVIPDGEYGTNGSTIENTIAYVTDATHLTLLDAAPNASSVQFLIDDPIDIERTSMDEMFCRMCEYEYACLSRQDKRKETQADMTMAILNAKAADMRTSPRQYEYIAPPTLESLAYANLGGR